ncbi:hypothetical protein HK097_011209 [Rhizophlyctis rosea]|uniref:Myb-like domain-containing protein n=1 Tax=Rhizophlyctis rosea TaxID=64517 RepID=A0AAD5SH17_9FUNG|nr:hypothetical protein HK097_011209 [Rhizophlyctis rosea]
MVKTRAQLRVEQYFEDQHDPKPDSDTEDEYASNEDADNEQSDTEDANDTSNNDDTDVNDTVPTQIIPDTIPQTQPLAPSDLAAVVPSSVADDDEDNDDEQDLPDAEFGNRLVAAYFSPYRLDQLNARCAHLLELIKRFSEIERGDHHNLDNEIIMTESDRQPDETESQYYTRIAWEHLCRVAWETFQDPAFSSICVLERPRKVPRLVYQRVRMAMVWGFVHVLESTVVSKRNNLEGRVANYEIRLETIQDILEHFETSLLDREDYDTKAFVDVYMRVKEEWFITMLYFIYHDAAHAGQPFDFPEGFTALRSALFVRIPISPINERWLQKDYDDLWFKYKRLLDNMKAATEQSTPPVSITVDAMQFYFMAKQLRLLMQGVVNRFVIAFPLDGDGPLDDFPLDRDGPLEEPEEEHEHCDDPEWCADEVAVDAAGGEGSGGNDVVSDSESEDGIEALYQASLEIDRWNAAAVASRPAMDDEVTESEENGNVSPEPVVRNLTSAMLQASENPDPLPAILESEIVRAIPPSAPAPSTPTSRREASDNFVPSSSPEWPVSGMSPTLTPIPYSRVMNPRDADLGVSPTLTPSPYSRAVSPLRDMADRMADFDTGAEWDDEGMGLVELPAAGDVVGPGGLEAEDDFFGGATGWQPGTQEVAERSRRIADVRKKTQQKRRALAAVEEELERSPVKRRRTGNKENIACVKTEGLDSRASSVISESSSFAGRKPWSKQEVQALEQGLMKYVANYGVWSKILKDEDFGPILAGRTNLQLKDKARNERMRRQRGNEELGVWDV